MKLNQQGSGHLVILLLLVLVAVCGIGYFVYQKTQDNEVVVTETDTTKPETEGTEAADLSVHSSAGADYVVIDEWGVKFPASTEDVKILWTLRTADNGDEIGIGFSTSRMAESEICVASRGATGTLIRQLTAINPDATVGAQIIVLNDNMPIGDYYYGFARPNGSSCENTNPSDEDETNMIQELAKNIEAV